MPCAAAAATLAARLRSMRLPEVSLATDHPLVLHVSIGEATLELPSGPFPMTLMQARLSA